MPVSALPRWACCARVSSREAPWMAGQISRDACSAWASPCRRQETARAAAVGGWLARAPGGRSLAITACALCSAAAARSPSALSMSAKTPARSAGASRWSASTRRACATSARHRARQPSEPASDDAPTVRTASLSKGEGATLGGVGAVGVMMAMVGPRPGGRMGTDPHSSLCPSPPAIGRQIGQQNPRGRTSGTGVKQPVAAPASRTEELASGSATKHRLAVGFARTRCQRCVTTASRGTRPRARWWYPRATRDACTGREGWAGAMHAGSRRCARHASTGSVSRSRRARLGSRARIGTRASGARRSRLAMGSLGALDGRSSARARRSRLRRSTSSRAREPCTSLRSGLSPRAKSLSSARRRTEHADAKRQTGSFELRADLFEHIQDLVGRASRYRSPS